MNSQPPLSSQQRVGIIPALKADRQSQTWHTVEFDPPFPGDTQVAVIPMTQTYNGQETPGLRIRNVTSEGFEIRFDEIVAQGHSADGAHLDETVAWIAYSVSGTEETPPETPGTGEEPTSPTEPVDITEDNIYQLIWESDENQFSVSPRNRSGEWENPDADILLDEQVKAAGKREIDLATHPLFHKVNEAKLFDDNRTYNNFIQLLDNYAVRSADPELSVEEEVQEQQAFLAEIVKTKPMQLARTYINQNLGEDLSEEQFRMKLQQIWFELYTNHYNGKSTNFASGFEHVFVGEGKFDIHSGSKKENFGEISGYHSWVKFYLDEKNQRVNYLGYKYDLKGEDGSQNPNVVTLQMINNVINMQGKVIAQLFKFKGGFFVGPSPECEMAMATVAYYESVHGKIIDKRRITINSATYDLVLYRSTNPNGSRGDFIRSFFPIFLGMDDGEIPNTDEPVVVPIDEVTKNNGVVIIVASQPNPEGNDEGYEWVELQNTTNEAIDLSGWKLQDKLNRPEEINGTLQPQEVKRFTISRANPNSMQLGNSSGIISLLNSAGQEVAMVSYSRASSGEVIRFGS
ncbi:lamin tail domain-containing protein [Coleofasciculus sp.]|uniref:lamin tail domain-containing protein n=1 Tax=Coleofasciculus sp. TaxID=3100458 RepID=UPI0039F84A38